VNGLIQHVVQLIAQQKQQLLHAMLEVTVLTTQVMLVLPSLNAQIINMLMELHV
jgi:hypothetical protein